MGKVTRSYALDPAVAAWLDKQPDGERQEPLKIYDGVGGSVLLLDA